MGVVMLAGWLRSLGMMGATLRTLCSPDRSARGLYSPEGGTVADLDFVPLTVYYATIIPRLLAHKILQNFYHPQ